MKFRDGMWLTAADKRVDYAECIYSIGHGELDGESLRLLAPTKRIRSRGDTLNCPTLTIDLRAECQNVMSVEVTHWSGGQRPRPNFELFPGGNPGGQNSIVNMEESRTLTAGNLAVTVNSNPQDFSIVFHPKGSSESLTAMLSRSVGFAYSPPPGNMKVVEDMRQYEHYIFTQTELAVGESVHGLGERFGGFNKVGQHVELWNEDGGTSSEQAYKNIPFWLSSRGYGIFINTPDRIDLEIGSQSPALPAWSYGLWLTTSFTTDYDEKTVTEFLQGMRQRSIPLEVFHYDCFWMRAFEWCGFEFSKDHFPDPQASIRRLKEANLVKKVCAWINPYLGQASPVFDLAAKRGYLVKRTNGDVWQWDLWQAGMGLLDVTNPEACQWYASCLEGLFDVGVDCLKTDFGERIPTKDVVWHDRSMDPSRMHNFYAFLYNKLCFEKIQERYGTDQGLLFARTATAGTQRFPLCWGGDCESTAAALAESIRGGLSIGLSGFSFWSCDIGGFEGTPPAWIYKRWVAFGLLCSHSRLHGSNSYRVPWLIDNDARGPESATGVLKSFVALKRRLMPYIMAEATESAEKGWPLSLRAMCIEYPDDPTTWFLDRQFMFGSKLLVAPVFSETGDVEFYLPAGRWFSWWTNEIVTGPGWRREKHDFTTIPLYWREGTVLTLSNEGGPEDSFDYNWFSGEGEVRQYGTREGDYCNLVNNNGLKVGKLVVTDSGRIEGTEALEGRWSH